MIIYDNMILAIGGDISAFKIDQVDQFDRAMGQWSDNANMILDTGLSHLCMLTLDDKNLYILGGKLESNDWTDEISMFNATDRWNPVWGKTLADAYNKPACLIVY